MTNYSTKHIALCGGALIGTLTTLGSAFAQEARPSDSQARLEEIVVTAQRRSDSLQVTPVAVTAISEEMLMQANIRTSQDLMIVTPGLQVSTQSPGDGTGSATFFLRGMGQQRSGNGSEPAVGIYVDDLYYPSLQGSSFSIVDLEQVEVLRGPQGTLFGRNTIGGAIRYSTKKPSNEFEGSASVSAGSYDRLDVMGAVNIPMGDYTAVRLTAGSLKTDGYVRQQNGGADAGGTESELYRVAARFKPTAQFTIDLTYQHSTYDLDGIAYYMPGPIIATPGLAAATYNTVYAPPRGLPLYDDAYRSQCEYCEAGTGRREGSDSRNESASLQVQWDLTENLTIKSLTGWQTVDASNRTDLDGSPLPIFDPAGVNETEARSQEFQANVRAIEDRLNLVGGVFFYDESNHLGQKPNELTTRIGVVQARATNNNRDTKSIAGFVDGSFDLTDQFSVLAGMRYNKDDKDVLATNPTTGAQVDARSGTFSSTTGRLGMRYRWTEDVMTYVTASTGFRGGGFNFTSNRYFEFEPEEATSIEAGARMEFFDNRLRINPTAFYTDWKNIQVQQVVPIATGSAIVLQNAAAATSYGFELEGIVQITSKFSISGNVATLDIGYDDVGTANGITVDSYLQRAPELTGGLGADYNVNFGNWETAFSANYSYQGEQYSTGTDSDRLRLPSYRVLGARIAITDPSEHLTLSFYGTNLTDEFYFVGGVNFAASGVGTTHYDVGRPREFGATIRYQF